MIFEQGNKKGKFQVSAVREMGTALIFDPLPLKTGPLGCPEKPVRDYHYTLRNSLEERSYRIKKG